MFGKRIGQNSPTQNVQYDVLAPVAIVDLFIIDSTVPLVLFNVDHDQHIEKGHSYIRSIGFPFKKFPLEQFCKIRILGKPHIQNTHTACV